MSPGTDTALRRERIGLLVLALAVLSSGLGLRDPWPPDEPRFALIAREMLAGGDWLIPHRNGEIYADKPPLFIWLSALAQSATGLRIGFLLPSLAAALATLALTHDLAARLWGRRAALAAGLSQIMSVQFAWQARFAQIDMALVACTTCGLYGMARHLLLGPRWHWWWIGCAAMGVGVVTKGVGVLPLFALVPWALARWRGLPGAARIGGSWWRWALGPAAMVAVIACWLVPMLVRVLGSHDPALSAYRDDLLVHQTVKRFADPAHHVKPIWHYLVNAPVLWLPLSVLLPWTIAPCVRRLRRGDARHWFLLGYAALVVLFFSLSPAKRGVYIFPALPAIVLALAPMLPALARRRAVARLALGLGAVIATTTLAGAAVATLMALPDRAVRELAEQGAVAFALPLLVIGLGAIVILIALRRRAVVGLVAVMCWAWFAFGWLGYPALAVRSPRALMTRLDATLGTSGLGMVDWREQYVLTSPRPVATFGYAGKVAPADEEAAALAWLIAADRRLLVPWHRAARFAGFPRQDLGFQNGTHWLLVAPPGGVTDAAREPRLSD
ncbi:MAG: glycosyltransferase family 39 protein [Planctomycetes bacterium]|nr:glycosyltransferase family 39 protein [Planctomycetota bacterium]